MTSCSTHTNSFKIAGNTGYSTTPEHYINGYPFVAIAYATLYCTEALGLNNYNEPWAYSNKSPPYFQPCSVCFPEGTSPQVSIPSSQPAEQWY